MKKIILLFISILGIMNSLKSGNRWSNNSTTTEQATSLSENDIREIVYGIIDTAALSPTESLLPSNGDELNDFIESASSGSSSKSDESELEYQSAMSDIEEEEEEHPYLTSELLDQLPSINFKRGNTKSLPSHFKESQEHINFLKREEQPEKKETIAKITYSPESYEHFLQEVGIFNKDESCQLLPAPKTILDFLHSTTQRAEEPRLSKFAVGAMITTPLIGLTGAFFFLDQVGTSAKTSIGTLATLGGLCAFAEYAIYKNTNATVYQTIKNILEEIPQEKISHIGRYAEYIKQHSYENPLQNILDFELMKKIILNKKYLSGYTCAEIDNKKIVTELETIKEKILQAQRMCRTKTFEIHQENKPVIDLYALLKQEVNKIESIQSLVSNVKDDYFDKDFYTQLKNRSATKIQSAVRGFLVRKKQKATSS